MAYLNHFIAVSNSSYQTCQTLTRRQETPSPVFNILYSRVNLAVTRAFLIRYAIG